MRGGGTGPGAVRGWENCAGLTAAGSELNGGGGRVPGFCGRCAMIVAEVGADTSGCAIMVAESAGDPTPGGGNCGLAPNDWRVPITVGSSGALGGAMGTGAGAGAA